MKTTNVATMIGDGAMRPTRLQGERTQFAAGPWRVDAETPNHAPIITAEDGKGRDLAEIRGESKDERAATARLIAAAPELFKEVKAFCDYYSGGAAPRLGNGQARKSLDKLLAIIAIVESAE